jgi:hypothetical protein
VGIKLGPSKKEEWGDQNMCQFQEPEQELKEGQSPLAKDETYFTEVDWCSQDVHD